MRIELDHVTKRFGRVTALNNVTLALPPGSRVALIGPNGSGKSTLTRVIMGLVAHDGQVRLDGLAPNRHHADLARRMAYVPQIAPQLGAVVRDVVQAIADLRGLDRTRIGELAGKLNLDLATVDRVPFRNLSGGMKQKLLLACALATRADLLIMDEPTASLDARTRDRFFTVFEEVAGRATLILCSHRLEEIRHLVELAIVLEEGRVVYDGPSAALLDGQTVCQIELCVADDRFADWLAQRGFRSARAGWWLRQVNGAEKMALLPEITATLGPQLRNLLVRDVELSATQLPPERRTAHA